MNAFNGRAEPEDAVGNLRDGDGLAAGGRMGLGIETAGAAQRTTLRPNYRARARAIGAAAGQEGVESQAG
ncbi:MAG: hypothetical protein WCT12_01570 [Verrucomicrobiota bacterium]